MPDEPNPLDLNEEAEAEAASETDPVTPINKDTLLEAAREVHAEISANPERGVEVADRVYSGWLISLLDDAAATVEAYDAALDAAIRAEALVRKAGPMANAGPKALARSVVGKVLDGKFDN